MPAIASGWVTSFFLYDVAEAIDLRGVSRLIGATAPVRMAPKPPTPPYLQYKDPPIVFEGQAVGMGDIDGFQVRFKTFDYGVVSVALTRPIPATWDRLLAEGLPWHDDARLAAAAERSCRALVERLRLATSGHGRSFFQRTTSSLL